MDKIYHIYAKDKCIYHNLPEEKFEETWSTLNNIVGIMKTEYVKEDLSYEELVLDKKQIQNSSY
jgi:hypothetical protein